jgi:hypothetical protein
VIGNGLEVGVVERPVEVRRFGQPFESQSAINECSTDDAPWHIVPADHKWYRNRIVSQIVHETLIKMDPQFPPAPKDLAKLVVE